MTVRKRKSHHSKSNNNHHRKNANHHDNDGDGVLLEDDLDMKSFTQARMGFYESSGRLFTIMYIVSYYLDVAEDWKHPWYKKTVLSFYVIYLLLGCSMKAYCVLLFALKT